MKFGRILYVFGVLLALAWTLPAWAGQVYRLSVDGLACPFCAYGVEKKVGAIEGVEDLEIDIDAGVVSVTMAEGATLDEATAKRAVDEAGFTLRAFEAVKTE